MGKQLLIYSYSLANTGTSKVQDDIERLKKKHTYKLRGCLESPAQSLTAMACANGFLSHIVLAAGSHKHIEVWDVAVEKCIHTFQDAHDKPAYCLRLNDAGTFSSHAAESYDLFLSASHDKCINLWDLRSGTRVCKLSGHSNRAHTVGASFSPCLRYVACGSEDKQAYVYDIRSASGTFVERLGGHTDVVTDGACACFFCLCTRICEMCVAHMCECAESLANLRWWSHLHQWGTCVCVFAKVGWQVRCKPVDLVYVTLELCKHQHVDLPAFSDGQLDLGFSPSAAMIWRAYLDPNTRILRCASDFSTHNSPTYVHQVPPLSCKDLVVSTCTWTETHPYC